MTNFPNIQERLGIRVIDQIQKGRLVRVMACGRSGEVGPVCDDVHVLVWGGNAAEQIGALVSEIVVNEFKKWADGSI